MPRSNRPRRGGRPAERQPGRPGGGAGDRGEALPLDEERARGGGRVEQHGGQDHVVRPVSGAAATKAYRCPGCDHEIPPGTPHVVAWALDARDGEGRRHWHTPCWTARSRRGPRR